MKLVAPFLAAFAITAVSLPALANLELAQKNGCTGCHAIDKKLVGPAYQEVAKKYASQPGAAAQLGDSIRKGGSGKWGPIPMPAQTLSLNDVQTLASWLADGAKQ